MRDGHVVTVLVVLGVALSVLPVQAVQVGAQASASGQFSYQPGQEFHCGQSVWVQADAAFTATASTSGGEAQGQSTTGQITACGGWISSCTANTGAGDQVSSLPKSVSSSGSATGSGSNLQISATSQSHPYAQSTLGQEDIGDRTGWYVSEASASVHQTQPTVDEERGSGSQTPVTRSYKVVQGGLGGGGEEGEFEGVLRPDETS